jgi:hypothetical protein
MLIIGLAILLAVAGITMLLLSGVNASPNILCPGPHCSPYGPGISISVAPNIYCIGPFPPCVVLR